MVLVGCMIILFLLIYMELGMLIILKRFVSIWFVLIRDGCLGLVVLMNFWYFFVFRILRLMVISFKFLGFNLFFRVCYMGRLWE